MSTGPLHYRTLADLSVGTGVVECRCTIGADHFHDGTVPVDDVSDSSDLSVWEAADIWASKGKDEDYMFGYTDDELERALGD